MAKLFEKYYEIKNIDETISDLAKKLSDAQDNKKNIINSCEHDLLVVYKYGYDNLAGNIFYARCLVCNEELAFNQDYYRFTSSGLNANCKKIKPESVLDLTDIISLRARENCHFGTNLCAERLRKTFVKLMHCDVEKSYETIKMFLIEEALIYEKEFYDEKNKFPEYTEEEICIAMQPDNTEIINPVCEECVDLCSENAKRKIK